jgi:formate-dependent nitrite reductase membrane component NrfD
MRFLFWFCVALIVICCYFGFTDKSGGYMFLVAAAIAVLLGLVMLFNTLFRGGPFSDKAEGPSNKISSFVLPLLALPAQQYIFLLVLLVVLIFFLSLRSVKRIK